MAERQEKGEGCQDTFRLAGCSAVQPISSLAQTPQQNNVILKLHDIQLEVISL